MSFTRSVQKSASYFVQNDHSERLKALEEELESLKELIDEQRKIIDILWHAPGMPGAQEIIEAAKESAKQNDAK